MIISAIKMLVNGIKVPKKIKMETQVKSAVIIMRQLTQKKNPQ